MERTKTETMEGFVEAEKPETEQTEAKQQETKQTEAKQQETKQRETKQEKNKSVGKRKEKEKKIRFKIPRGNSEKEQRDVFVSVNGKTWQIKRGVVNELPESVVEVLENAEAQRDFALEYQESVKEQIISENV